MESAATLVFPHQLFADHPAISDDRTLVLIEDTLFFGDKWARPGRFHQQKIVLHRASMKAFQKRHEETGRTVRYLEYDRDKGIQHHIADLVEEGFTEFHCAEPCDFLLEKRLRRVESQSDCQVTFHDTPMFLTPQSWADEHFDSRKKPFMAAFYEAQRKRMGILIDKNGEPTGGSWSYDDENRKPMPKRGGLDVPPDPAAENSRYISNAKKYVEKEFPDYPGSVDSFSYPVDHESSRDWLEKFFEERFDQFGPYEDAISQKERVLFHGVLTPMLNIGLLTPKEVIESAINYADEHDVPLNSLEGFIRQIIGWREFMYCMYRRHGVEMRNSNFFEFDRELPKAFWTGDTEIEPVDHTIHRVLDYAYCHHIERLMVLGNFMLLGGFHPHSVFDWFMELFIDAYDWVMVPNIYGMSQFADGGIFTTKPYISGSNYIRKMSDYPKGDWCDTWDALFWQFIETEREFFSNQHRLSMMVRNLDKMDSAKLEKHRKNADAFFERFA